MTFKQITLLIALILNLIAVSMNLGRTKQGLDVSHKLDRAIIFVLSMNSMILSLRALLKIHIDVWSLVIPAWVIFSLKNQMED